MSRKLEHFFRGMWGALNSPSMPVYTGSGYMPAASFGAGTQPSDGNAEDNAGAESGEGENS